jgi:alginate O-acetyltransferase complex protein AlgI
MSAYLPCDAATAWLIAAVWVLTLLAGFLIIRIRPLTAARSLSWALVVFGAVGVERLSEQEPAGLRMLALIVVVLFAMKAVVCVEAQVRLSPLRWLGFAAVWPGMRPAPFATASGPPRPDAERLLRLGTTRMLQGVALFVLAWLLWAHHPSELSSESAAYLVSLLLLPGLSLLLHFGIFNVLAGLWCAVGVDCRPLFRAPLRARCLTEFWGRRWNLAFSEMTALAVYRPLAAHLGKPAATGAAFLFSGLLHELAISMPVRAGYGLPMLYFTLHGCLVLVERRLKRSIEGRGWLAHFWTLGWLAVPMPLVFHPFFLKGVVWPLVGIGP